MDFLTLTELNWLVADKIKKSFPETYWVMAEISSLNINQYSGHCYLELVEKNNQTGNPAAKAKAYVWNSTFLLLRPYFEETTGQSLAPGLKILVKVAVEFHPLHGYGLNISDIEPSYTLGDMQMKRQAIIRQLEEDGVLTLNKELELSQLPQRIAIVASETSAGYEDFLKHLNANRPGFVFYPKLFTSVMQGEQTEKSVIAALERIFKNKELFDVVVIIRGGGATSDLSAFDSYLLAAACAQFPLPVITGIGHERDDTVLDVVAFYKAKTPTAVADYLIQQLIETHNDLYHLKEAIRKNTDQILSDVSLMLQNVFAALPVKARSVIEKKTAALDLYQLRIRNAGKGLLSVAQSSLDKKESFIKMSSPEYILSKGYSITMKNGKAIKSSAELSSGDQIKTILHQGEIVSVVKK